jgi:hypothetical protein
MCYISDRTLLNGMGELTANIMNPGRPFHEKDVVTQKEEVETLEHQEDMPCCWSIRIDID